MVRWRVSSEPPAVGMALYRELNGARVRLRRPMTADGSTYRAVDRAAPLSRALRYWIRAVAADGSWSWHGPLRIE